MVITSTMGGDEMDFKLPKNETELSTLLNTAYAYACNRNYEKALELCDWLSQNSLTRIAGQRQRAAVKTHMGDIDGAIIDLKSVLETDRLEPADFHGLGMLLLQNGSTEEAIEQFSNAVQIGETAGNHYYTNSSLLFRAEAKLKICDFTGAMQDVSGLPSGYKAYFSGTGMRSKEDIDSEAEIALQLKERSKFKFKK